MSYLRRHIEALIFCSPEPISLEEILECITEMFDAEVPEHDVLEAIGDIEASYQSEEAVFALYRLGGGFQFLTKPAYQSSISILLKQKSKKKLSNSALETLSIIAYKQPVSKIEVEQIRGVNCDYAVQRLLEKELVEIKGKSESVGRPLIYGTTPKFLEYFGINSLTELPQPKDILEDNPLEMNE